MTMSAAVEYAMRAEAKHGDTAELSYDVMEHSLDTLGLNSESQLVFTCCTLRSRHLKRVDLLSSFPFLQRLILDHNELTSLAPLGKLHSLAYLSARHNSLTSAVFEHLCASADALEYLALDHNNLTSLDGLQKLPYLMVLTASHNCMDALCEANMRGLGCLLRLDVAHNDITRIDAHCFLTQTQLRRVRLAHNRLMSVLFARDLIATVEELDLSHNHLCSLEGVFDAAIADAAQRGASSAHTLAVLDLSSNDIRDIGELACLGRVHSLHALNVSGNPCLETPPPAASLPSSPMLEQAAHAATIRSINTDACIDEALQCSDNAHPNGQGASTVRASAEDANPNDAAVPCGVGTAAAATKQSRRCSTQLGSPTRRGSKSKRTPAVPSLSSSAPHPVQASALGTKKKTKSNNALLDAEATHYTALSAPQVLGLVRHVLTAPASREVVKRVERQVELARLPRAQQTALWLLYTLPRLVTLDGKAVDMQDVARARYFFAAM